MPAAPASPGQLPSFPALIALALSLAVAVSGRAPLAATVVSLVLSACIALGPRHRTRSGRRAGPVTSGVVAAAVIGVFTLATTWRGGALIAPGLLALIAAAGIYHRAYLERWLRLHRACWPLIVAGSLALSCVLIGSTLAAKWHPIDDHDIAAWLGTKGAIGLADIPSLVMRTEVGQPGGELPRYRPAYFLLRGLETFLWGSNITAWWTSHLVILAASIALTWRFFSLWLGLVGAAVLVLYLMTDPYWIGILPRLGTAEVYCVLGTSMYLLGFAGLARASGGRSTRSWILLTAGALIAMGSKENFLLMLPPLWVLAATLIRRRRLGVAGAVASLLLSAYGALVAWAVVTSIARTGQDVYQQSVSVHGRLAMVGDGLVRSLRPLTWWDVALAALVLAATLIVVARGRALHGVVSPVARGALVAAGVCALYAAQYVFYGGQWPAAWPATAAFLRYNFPGVPARALMLAALAYWGLRLLRRLGFERRLVRAFGAGLVAGLLFLVVDAGFGLLRAQAALTVRATRLWTASLEATVATLGSAPARPVVVFNRGVTDAEPVFSVPRFLAARRVTNPLFLRVEPYPARPGLEARIRQWLTEVSTKGGVGYAPMDRLPPDGTVFGIGLSGEAPERLGDATVVDAGVLWPIGERRRR